MGDDDGDVCDREPLAEIKIDWVSYQPKNHIRKLTTKEESIKK